MRNIIKTEFLKLKRYSVIKAGIIMATLSPLLSLFYSTANGGQTWTFDYFMQQVMISNCTLFFPIIIALIAGYIITREYTDDTMKNISTIPIPYKQLLSGKLLVLLLLTICFSLIGCVLALVINVIAGFPGVHFGNLLNMFIRVTGANIGIYISVLPIILLFCCSANNFLGGVALAFVYGYFGTFEGTLLNYYPIKASMILVDPTCGAEYGYTYHIFPAFIIMVLTFLISVIILANKKKDATITKLVNDDRVQVGVSHLLGLVSYGDYKLTVRSIDEILMKLAKYPDLEGKLPKSTNEIAITKAFLDRAGLSKSIGDTISLNLGDGEKDYTLCGILPVENSNYSVFVSQSYIENKISEPAYSAYIRLNESDGWSKAAIQAELSTLCRELEIQPEQMQFSTYYFSLIEQRSSQYITVIAFISLIIALACTLVIYSLFYVSIARKTKEYGKLRTIGATGKQMKRIVFREGFHLSRIAIPIGILAGAIAGYVLVPQGWNTLMVFVIAAVTALFVYLCVMIAVIKPAKIAAHVTPIEAVRYMAGNNDVMSNSTKVLHRSLSAKNLAFLNFARNRKKTALTILSLGVCGILLMASSAYFNSIDPLAMARRSFPYGEIRLELGDYGPQAHNSEQYSELQKSNLLTEDFRESILDIDGVEEIKEYQGTVLNVRMPTGDIEPIVSDAYTPSSQKLLEQYLIDGTADLQELLNNNGIIIENGPQWKETFGWDAAIGDELLIEVGGQTLEVKVMGIVDANIPYGGYDTLFIPLEMLSKIVPIDNLNYQFIVDTDDSKWAAAKDEIQKIIPPTSSLYVSTLNDWVEAYNEKLLNYRMPVYIFIMFIGVFGIINLLNTLITNILTRKRELGVLQAVGLSSKQLSKMLLIEGLFYTLGVLLLSISCGTLIGYLLCTVFSAMSIFGKVSYHFPTVEMFSYFILMLAVQMLFSCFAIRQIKKQSLVDQIRELS